MERRDWKRIKRMVEQIDQSSQFWQSFFWAVFPLAISFFLSLASLPDNSPWSKYFFTAGWCCVVASVLSVAFWWSSGNRDSVSKQNILDEMNSAEDDIAVREEVEVFNLLSASYGTEKNSFDVTEVLKARITRNSLTVKATNDIAGDPEKGVVKKLKIRYSHLGVSQEIEVSEGQEITIPQFVVV